MLLPLLWLAPLSAQEMGLDDLRLDVDISDLESELGDDIREFSKKSGLVQEAPEAADLEMKQVDILHHKREVMRSLDEVLNLEQQLLYPHTGQWVLLLSSAAGSPPQLVEVTLDGKRALRRRFDAQEQKALKQAAVFPAQLGFFKPGTHRLEVKVTTAKGEVRQTLKLRSLQHAHFVQASMSGRAQPKLQLAHWGP